MMTISLSHDQYSLTRIIVQDPENLLILSLTKYIRAALVCALNACVALRNMGNIAQTAISQVHLVPKNPLKILLVILKV